MKSILAKAFNLCHTFAMDVQLSKGMVAKIDDEDWDLIRGFTWSVTTGGANMQYATTRDRVSKKHVRMHRMIFGENDPTIFVDHINGDTLDNRRANLRRCSHAQNLANSKMSSDNTSGYKGVFWAKHAKKWRAIIGHAGVHQHLGYFASAEDAASAYNTAAQQMKGVYARLNPVD